MDEASTQCWWVPGEQRAADVKKWEKQACQDLIGSDLQNFRDEEAMFLNQDWSVGGSLCGR